MFGLGFSEIIVLAVIGLIVLGPEELPKLARNLGRIFNDVKRSADDFKTEIQNHVDPPNPYNYQDHIAVDPVNLTKPQDPKVFHQDEEQLELFVQSHPEPIEEQKKENSST